MCRFFVFSVFLHLFLFLFFNFFVISRFHFYFQGTLAAAGPLFIGTVDYIVDDSVLGQLQIRAIVSCLPHAPDGIQEVLQRNDIRDEDYMLFPLEVIHAILR